MKKDEVPQDLSSLGKITKEVCYATDSEGKYVAGVAIGALPQHDQLQGEAGVANGVFLTQGIDFFQNPQTRSFVVSVTLNR